MRDRDAAKRKAITSNDPHDWKRYKKLRNIINNDIKISKASYYSNAFIQSKGNPRKTWQTFNELTSRRVNNTTVKELKLNDTIISNSSELSDAFNDHFSTIGPRLANEIPLTAENNSSYINNIKVNNNNFSFSSTNCSIVFSHLNKLCRSKATGLDNISAKIVRECADLISVSLCDLFNKSLVSGIFPDDWKCARVTPLFKEGLNSCQQRLLFVRQLNSKNVASTRRVGLNQNLITTWKGLMQIPLSHIWRMMPYYRQNFTIDWLSFLLQFQSNVMAWLCQHFIFPRCHCCYCLSVLPIQTSVGFNRKPFLLRYMTRV